MARPAVRYAALAAPVLLGLAACIALPNEDKTTVANYIGAPMGAVPPDGLDQIRKGDTQAEVLGVLRPMYRVIHAADAEPSSPIADFFPYTEDGTTKYIEIFYTDDGRVDWIRYGYEETFALE